MKLRVDVERCCGHARCATVAPDIFILNDLGYLTCSTIDVQGEQEALAQRGARACPERCISVIADKR
jgi:ferredoxin